MTTYTVEELVPVLRMSKRAIRKLFTSGRLRGLWVGRQYLTTEECVRLFLGEPRTAAPGPNQNHR